MQCCVVMDVQAKISVSQPYHKFLNLVDKKLSKGVENQDKKNSLKISNFNLLPFVILIGILFEFNPFNKILLYVQSKYLLDRFLRLNKIRKLSIEFFYMMIFHWSNDNCEMDKIGKEKAYKKFWDCFDGSRGWRLWVEY